MKKYLILMLFGVFFLSACGLKQASPDALVTTINTNMTVNKEATAKNLSEEIANPNLVLPVDIDAGQIQQYFQLDNFYYALVMQSSMNILLETSSDFQSKFVGVLKAGKGATVWNKYLEIKDKNATDKNNPYYFWLENDQLYLSVVDQNGAGSGEGILKVFNITNKQAGLIGCYYYPGSVSAETYFSNTKNINQFDSQPMGSCNNVIIILK